MGVKLGLSHWFREFENWDYREEVTGDWEDFTVRSFVVWTVHRMLVGMVRSNSMCMWKGNAYTV